jgi:hypothetical protein
MRHSSSLHLLGNTTPAQQFGRIARTIPAPHRLSLASAESANAASLAARAEVDEAGAVARRTLGASGFGDAALAPEVSTDVPDSDALQAAARAHRARRMGEIATALLRAAMARVRGWRVRYRRHVDAQAIHRELAGLDSRTLRDLGIHHRGELRFIAQRLAHGEDLHEFNGQR